MPFFIKECCDIGIFNIFKNINNGKLLLKFNTLKFENIHINMNKNVFEKITDITECCICYENIENIENISLLKCGHYFCKNCFDKCLQINDKCPMCRQ